MIKSLHKFWLETPRLRWWLRFIVACLMFWLLSSRVDFWQVWAVLKQANVRYFVPAILFYLLARYLLAYQISLASNAIGQPLRVCDLLKIQLMMSFYSIVLPGDLLAGGVGWYKMAKINRKAVESGALLVYLRLINTAVLLFVGLIGFGFDPHLDNRSLELSAGLMLLGIIFIMLPFLSKRINNWFDRPIFVASGKLPLSESLLKNINTFWDTIKFFNGLECTNLYLFAISVLVEALHTLIYFLIARSVGINLPMIILAWIRSALTIIQMIPISIAGLGIREISLIWMLNRYGIPETKSLGFSLLILAYLICTGLIGGIIEAWDVMRGTHKHE